MSASPHDHGEWAHDGYTLLYPLVACVSNGGACDDRPFVAGMNCGRIAGILETNVEEYVTYVEPELVPQLDPVAMHHGYSLATEPWDRHPEAWTRATFRRDGAA